ncbi:hypothetical protein L1887_10486 [Cichorium endivia]|nr:hypothetical protein L1887_10486 [Cichorium endivia]
MSVVEINLAAYKPPAISTINVLQELPNPCIDGSIAKLDYGFKDMESQFFLKLVLLKDSLEGAYLQGLKSKALLVVTSLNTMIIETFGSMLFLPEAEILEEVPTSESMKYRILISTKTSKRVP